MRASEQLPVRLCGALLTCTVFVACEPPEANEARKRFATGDLIGAAALFDLALQEKPSEQTKAELAEVWRAALKRVAAIPKDGSVAEAEVDLAIRAISADTDPIKAMLAYRHKSRLAEARGDLAAAIDALKSAGKHGQPLPSAQALAALLRKHPEHDPAAQELSALATAHPADVSICMSHAGWMGERKSYRGALTEYDRCDEVDAKTFEQALYIGAQKATLNAYLKPQSRKATRKRR